MTVKEEMTLMKNNYYCVYILDKLQINLWIKSKLGYWRFDEGKGLAINDMSDNEFNSKLMKET